MNLIEKKCPNCGANMKFEENDSKCYCEYCKNEFLIHKDQNDNFTFTINKATKAFLTYWITSFIFSSIISIIIFIAVIALFVFIGIEAFKQSHEQKSTSIYSSVEMNRY